MAASQRTLRVLVVGLKTWMFLAGLRSTAEPEMLGGRRVIISRDGDKMREGQAK